MPESINSKIREQYDHDDSGGSLDTNQGDFLDSEGASGTSNNTKWRNWAEGTGTSLNTRLFHKHGGSGSFNTRWKNWIAFGSTHSFNLDGSNDYLSFDQDIAVSGDFSISWWMYVTDETQGFAPLFYKAGNYVLYFRDNGDFLLRINSFSGETFSSASVVLENQWHHFALVRSGSSVDLYVDKTSIDDTKTISGGSFTFNQIGFDSGSSYLDALIDEVAVWNTALSASDVTSVYNNGKIVDLSKSASYGVDRTANLKLWLRCGDKVEPESDASIARSDFYTDFDGTDHFVSVADNDDLSFGSGSSDTPFSISAWINPVDATNFTIVSKGVFNTDAEYILQLDGSDKLYLGLYDESVDNTYEGAYFNTALTSYQNSWFHVCATYNGVGGTSANAGIKLYIDGVEKSTSLTGGGTYVAMENLGGELEIGRISSTYANGKISNLALYKTQLDSQTISQMAKSRFSFVRNSRFSVVDFDGSNDHIDCGVDVHDFSSGDFTISGWISHDTANSANAGIVGVRDSTNTEVQLYISPADNKVYSWNGSTNVGSTTAIADEVWTHVAMVQSGSNKKFYINGVLDNTASQGHGTARPATFKIGWTGSGGEYFKGSISNISVYNVEKSADEIYAIYQQGITYDESSLSGLQGYWRMGDDTSASYPTIADSSSNSNDGTITNGASDDIVQQMVAGYDMGAFESSSEELGAERFGDPTFSSDLSEDTNDSNWRVQLSGLTISDGRLRYSDSGIAYLYAKKDNSDVVLTLNKLYKLVFTIYDNTATFAINTYNGGSVADALVSNASHSVGTHTFYVTPTSAHTQLRLLVSSVSSSFSMDDFSVKEVLQSADLSDSYPAIIDVNEPVLGAELITNGTFDSNITGWGKTHISSTPDVTYNNGKARIAYSSSGNTINIGINTTTNPFSGITGIVQVTGNIQIVSGSIASSSSFKVYETNTANKVSVTLDANGDFTAYIIVGSNQQLGIFASADVCTFEVDNITAKQVSGNVGTMTNQDSADLVYSSVLPDQSFLTGVNSAYNYIDLDGSDEYIASSSNIGISGSNAFTMMCWFNLDAVDAYQTLTSSGAVSSGAENTFLVYNTNKLAWNNQIGANDFQVTSGTTFATGTWYHGAVTYDGNTTLKLYVNGEVEGTKTDVNTSTSINITNSALNIGRRNDNSLYTNGQIGQVAVYNKALSATEVGAIYTLGRHDNLLDSYSDNLKGYWAMSALDASTGLSDVGNGTIYDRSGQSNHGTATNTEASDLASSPNAEPNGYAKGDTNRSTTTP